MRLLLPHIVIFARCEPKQKEFIIITLQNLGYSTLMCGDGTNDVGALKHAQVGQLIVIIYNELNIKKITYTNIFILLGVAILSSPPERASKHKQDDTKNENVISNSMLINGPRMNSRMSAHARHNNTKIQKLIKQLEQEDNVVVKLGDASIAAPFTSKMSSIECSKYDYTSKLNNCNVTCNYISHFFYSMPRD